MKLKFYSVFYLFLAVVACTNAQNEGTTKFTNKVDEYLSKYQEVGFSGAILVAEAGKITLNKGYGYANDSTWAKVSPQTVWTLGSVTKPITAIAILQLEAMGKLSTEDPINKYIDGVSEHIGGITIHQLLTHTAGLKEYSGFDSQMVDTEGFLAHINNSELKFNPGETFSYSNVGYTMLGIIIETITGQDYEHFLKQNIFEPAGMKNTGYNLPKWDISQFAIGYTSQGKWGTVYQKNGYESGVSWNLKGNGGLLSTPEDMYKLHLALRGTTLLSKEAKEKMYGKYVQTPGDFSPFNDKSPGFYGYGWGMTESAAFEPIIMHGGSNDIFEAGYMYYPEDDIFFFIASNRTSKNAVPAIFAIDKIVSKKKYELPEADVIPDSEIAQKLEGTYAFSDGSKFTIVKSEEPSPIKGSLTVRPVDKGAYRKIVGDKIEDEMEARISEFITELLHLSANNKPYNLKFSSKAESQKKAKDEDVDVSYGVDQKPLRDQLSDFWEENQEKKGTYTSCDIWGVVGVGDRYWVQVKLAFENGEKYMNFSISQDDSEIKRFSTSHRAVGLLLKPKTTFKYQEVNSGGLYDFTLNKSSGNAKIKSKLKGEKLYANKKSTNES